VFRIPSGVSKGLADSLLKPYVAAGGGLSPEGIALLPDGRGGFKPVYTNEFMARHLIQNDRKPDGTWIQQPYFAVTVPEHVGFDPQFTLEGLVYRVNPDTLGPEVDEAVTHKALYETFKYRGLFKADGSWDTSVYKDENSETLSRNYAAAHINLGLLAHRQGRLDVAIAEFERVARMFPTFSDVLLPLGTFYIERGDTTKALELYTLLTQRDPNDPESQYYLAMTLAYRGRIEQAAQAFDRAIQLRPDLNMAYLAAHTMLWDAGRREQSLRYIERWLDRHPEDGQARELYETRRGALGGGVQAPKLVMPRPLNPQGTP
jgi:lipoprotein NlpI